VQKTPDRVEEIPVVDGVRAVHVDQVLPNVPSVVALVLGQLPRRFRNQLEVNCYLILEVFVVAYRNAICVILH
jgi:hypothetical protein